MRKPSDGPAFVKLSQAARAVGVSPSTIQSNATDFFAVVRLGAQRYVRQSELQAWLNRHAVTDSHVKAD